jgi:hypothetical protein
MTLVLAWQMVEGIAVVADTRFGAARRTVGEAGPKIFHVPIVLNKHGPQIETIKHRLPSMGFAFAGNVFAGQAANALASTSLQNLLVHDDFDDGPTVAEVAALFARCSALVVNERRSWNRTDEHLFDGFVFGRSSSNSNPQLFVVEVSIGDDAMAQCEPVEVDLSSGALAWVGDGGSKLSQILDKWPDGTPEQPAIVSPLDLLRMVMEDPDVPSVAGHQQFAVATPSGVELRPGLRVQYEETVIPFGSDQGKPIGQQRIDFQILGFDLADIGNVGKYFTGATHFASG